MVGHSPAPGQLEINFGSDLTRCGTLNKAMETGSCKGDKHDDLPIEHGDVYQFASLN